MHVTRKASRYASPVYCDLGASTELRGVAAGRSTAPHGRPSVNLKDASREGAARQRIAPRRGAARRALVLGEAELKRIEDALLDALLDHHTNRDNALDRLLDDMGRMDAERRCNETDGGLPAEEKLASLAAMRKERIEELLVAAVLDNHPNRSAALDRILGDIEVVSESQIAKYNMQFDTDFDGLA